MNALGTLGDYLASIITNDTFSWIHLIRISASLASIAYSNLVNHLPLAAVGGGGGREGGGRLFTWSYKRNESCKDAYTFQLIHLIFYSCIMYNILSTVHFLVSTIRLSASECKQPKQDLSEFVLLHQIRILAKRIIALVDIIGRPSVKNLTFWSYSTKLLVKLSFSLNCIQKSCFIALRILQTCCKKFQSVEMKIPSFLYKQSSSERRSKKNSF